MTDRQKLTVAVVVHHVRFISLGPLGLYNDQQLQAFEVRGWRRVHGQVNPDLAFNTRQSQRSFETSAPKKEKSGSEDDEMEKGRASMVTSNPTSSFSLSLFYSHPMFLFSSFSVNLCVQQRSDRRLRPLRPLRGSDGGHGDRGVSLRPGFTSWSTSGHILVNISGVFKTLKLQRCFGWSMRVASKDRSCVSTSN